MKLEIILMLDNIPVHIVRAEKAAGRYCDFN